MIAETTVKIAGPIILRLLQRNSNTLTRGGTTLPAISAIAFASVPINFVTDCIAFFKLLLLNSFVIASMHFLTGVCTSLGNKETSPSVIALTISLAAVNSLSLLFLTDFIKDCISATTPLTTVPALFARFTMPFTIESIIDSPAFSNSLSFALIASIKFSIIATAPSISSEP